MTTDWMPFALKRRALVLALLLCPLGVLHAVPAATPGKPNALFILCDDLRPHALAALLAAEGLTPDQDKMPLDEGIKAALPDQKIR